MLQGPRILVCTDFSESAERAMKFSRHYAHKTKGQLHLLHVADLGSYLSLNCEMPAIREDIIDVITENLIKRLHIEATKCKISADVKVLIDSNVTDGILKDIFELKPDIVILGATGQSGLASFFLGSVARKVGRFSPVPVLIVRDENEVTKVAALHDASDDMSGVLNAASFMTGQYSASLDVISLVPQWPGFYSVSNLEYSTRVAQEIKSAGEIAVKKCIGRITDELKGKIANVIVKPTYEKDTGYHLTEILHDEGIDLAVLKRSNRNRIEEMVLGSVASRVMEIFKGNILLC